MDDSASLFQQRRRYTLRKAWPWGLLLMVDFVYVLHSPDLLPARWVADEATRVIVGLVVGCIAILRLTYLIYRCYRCPVCNAVVFSRGGSGHPGGVDLDPVRCSNCGAPLKQGTVHHRLQRPVWRDDNDPEA